jgi:hypothetical protein
MGTTSSHFLETPHTKLGWWSIRLAAVFLIMFFVNTFVFMPTSSDAPWRHLILPFYGITMLLCGLVSGIIGWMAVLRWHERSWLVLFTLLPGLWVLFMLIGEFLFPH